MNGWNRVAALAAACVLVGCAARDDFDYGQPSATESVALGSQMPALESAMMGVAQKVVWSFPIPDVRVNGATVQGNDLLVDAFETTSRHYIVLCFDAPTGTPRWKLDLGVVPLKFPPLAGDRFVVMLLDDGAGMVVVNRRTGAREYNVATAMRVIPSGAAGSSESTVFMPSLVDNRIHALNPSSGMSGWHFRLDGTLVGGPMMTPRLPRRLVVVGTDMGEVVAYPASAWDETPPANPIWSRRLMGDVGAEMTVADLVLPTGRQVSVIVPCEDRGLYCLESATGDPRWVHRTDHPFRSRAEVAGGKVFCRNIERMHVIDLASGTPSWKGGEGAHQSYETCSGALTADAKRCFLWSDDRRVHRIDAKTGEVRATSSLAAFDLLVPSGDANVLLGITTSGMIVAGG